MEGVLIVFIVFGSIASLFLVPRYLKSIERQKMADTMRAAIETGQPLPTEIFDAMSTNVRTVDVRPTPQKDLRSGIIWLCLAGGLATLGLIAGFENPDATYWFFGFAAVPGFIGLAFLLLGLLNRKKL